MASTSTNKQPLLVDRVFHTSTDLVGSSVEPGVSVDIGGSNSANLVLDCTKNDGAVIECLYAVLRQAATPYAVYLYLSSASDFLRSSQSFYIGGFIAQDENQAAIEGAKSYYYDMPFVMAPVPHVGSESSESSEGVQFRGLYIPKGKALWAAVEKQSASDTTTAAPILHAQGGYF